MKTGLVSIVIPVYNRVDLLRDCLSSIKEQEYRSIEVIIVNDGSTEDVRSVVNDFAVTHYIEQVNQGAPAARNSGRKKAQGEFVLFCDADVHMRPMMISVLVAMLQANPQTSYAYSGFMLGKKALEGLEFDAEKLRKFNWISTMALIRSKDIVPFDTSLKRFQDWDLWLTLLDKGKVGIGTNEILFRSEPGGTMSEWLPSFFYKVFTFTKRVKEYNSAREIVLQKHNLK